MSDDRLFDLESFEPTLELPVVAEIPRPADDAPADQPDRDRITHELDSTLFVEAGAGSGKTTALVGRILSLVGGEDPVPLRNVAAITFTEKAAGELRDRVRSDLESAIEDMDTGDPARRQRWVDALDDLDGAAISTLHAFAQRILSEHPVEAGLPPAIEVLDEISSQVAFEQRWAEQLDQLLDDPELAETILLATAAGIDERHLRDLAVAFNENWDLVASRLPAPTTARLNVHALVAEGRAVVDRRIECRFDDDTLVETLGDLEVFIERLDRARDEPEAMALLTQATRTTGGLRKASRRGRKGNWDDVDSVRADYKQFTEALADQRAAVIDTVIKELAGTIGTFTLEAANERRRQGRLEFHDLLVQARELLRSSEHGPDVRRALRERYQRLLLDEFQDTDPIQIELAALLAVRPDAPVDRPWDELELDAGRLFFVGDPKQSIYRFRRADISLFLDARDRFGSPPVRLTTNFRSAGPVIDWVNHVFGLMIRETERSQPRYEPLAAKRAAPPSGPGVMTLGRDHHEGKLAADPLRELEAGDVAAVVVAAMTEQWPVFDDDSQQWRPPRLGDITILLPARTSLPALERALDDANVAHRAETSSLVWSTREIRDLMMCLRAVDDPTDELALVSALRSSVYGCGDDDLYRFRREHRGSWNHQRPVPESVASDDPVAEAIAHMAGLHRDRMWSTPSELLERLIRDRRVFEHGISRGRPRDVWRRLRFVLDQARAYGDSEGGSLRQFLSWAQLQSAEGARVSETVLPETDDDSVRIMTIHGAKGLEFPITIVSGLTTQPATGRRGVVAAFPNDGSDAVIRLGSALETREYEWFVPVDEQMGHDERLRLLYVACTRAKDHLVVSLHRTAPPKQAREDRRRSSADLLAQAATDAEARPFVRSVSADRLERDLVETEPAAVDDYDRWRARRDAAVDRGTRRSSVSATHIADRAKELRLDPGYDKAPQDLDLPPWRKGRFGTSVGRAVHAVLQTIDLRTGAGVDAQAQAQAAAEGVVGTESTVAALVRSALASDTVQTASLRRHWREVYVAVPVNGVLVEGYIDLMYAGDHGGVVIVDHKTDEVPDAATLQAKGERYRLQAATYALAVRESTGLEVERAELLFLDPDGSTAYEIVNIDEAMTEVERIVHDLAAAP